MPNLRHVADMYVADYMPIRFVAKIQAFSSLKPRTIRLQLPANQRANVQPSFIADTRRHQQMVMRFIANIAA
jgi:hypothetical protein